jgi:two-component system cell cycle response regulator DivK
MDGREEGELLPGDSQDGTDKTSAPQRNSGVAKILIVEDSPDNMKLFRTLLTLKGHEVVGLAGGEGLLDAIERGSFDLVLMDIQLPGKDGFTLLREIRGSPCGTLRVIALTAHAMTGDRERALQAGFDGYITKPIEVRAFPDQVQRALRGERLGG